MLLIEPLNDTFARVDEATRNEMLTKAAKAALEYLASQYKDPERANMWIDETMREKLVPLGIQRGYSYETIRRGREGRVGPELLKALKAYFELDEAAFLHRFAGVKPPETRHEALLRLIDAAIEARRAKGKETTGRQIQDAMKLAASTGELTLHDVLSVMDAKPESPTPGLDSDLEDEHARKRGARRRR